MRKIKFLPDTGNMLTVEAEETLTVGQFIQMLVENNVSFDLNKNLLTEKKTKASFMTSDAVLPEGDISLFSVIKDPKGNAPTSRADVYAAIKELKDTYGDYVKQHFGNYTQVATDQLLKLLKSFSKSEARKSMGKKTPSTTKVVSKPTVKKQSNEELELRAAQKAFVGNVYRKK